MKVNESAIEAACQRLEHRLGWRLLTCPEGNIETAAVALITINPGGKDFEKPKWSVENGSAYVVEEWKGFPAGCETLQRQVRCMFKIMEVEPENVLSGYLVPFRSPNWRALRKQKDSIQFGIKVWREILGKARNIKTVVSFGKDTTRHVTDLLEAECYTKCPANWGEQTIDVYRYRFGTGGKLIVLPHLSRYKLFNRPPNRPQSEDAFRAAWKKSTAPLG